MTLTSTGPSGFHIKPIVTVFAVVAFVAAAYVIAQQIWTDNQPGVFAPSEAPAQTAEPYAGNSGLTEAFAAGKLDAGLNPIPSETFAGSEPAPEIVVIEGQGSLYDALSEGKYDLDFSPGDPAVQYVLVPAAAVQSGGQLVEGFGDGPFTELSETSAATGPATEIVAIEGQGSHYDALIEGKYDPDFAPGHADVQYVLVRAAATDSGGQLVEGFGDGPFAEPSPTTGTAGHTPTVSGGPQE